MAARARPAPLGRSKLPLELARLRQGARICSAWLLENSAPADVSDFELPRGRSWLEMAAEPAPKPQNARKVLLKPGPEPQNAREVLLEPAEPWIPKPRHTRYLVSGTFKNT